VFGQLVGKPSVSPIRAFEVLAVNLVGKIGHFAPLGKRIIPKVLAMREIFRKFAHESVKYHAHYQLQRRSSKIAEEQPGNSPMMRKPSFRLSRKSHSGRATAIAGQRSETSRQRRCTTRTMGSAPCFLGLRLLNALELFLEPLGELQAGSGRML
jgi:hypothetical protein